MEDKTIENKALVLVVDDQPLNRQVFSIILEKLGYEAVYAEDGQEALDKTESENIGIIFIDIQMPRMNGCEATKILRERGFRKPIIAVTSLVSADQDDEKKQYIKAGMDDLMLKPVRRQDIEMMLQKWENKEHQSIAAAKPAAEPAGKPAGLSSPANAVFDAGEMLAAFLNNEKLALSLLGRFIERTEAQIAKLPVLEETGDLESARRDAHTIKSAALTMGGAELGKAAARLELAYINNQKSESEAAYPQLCAAFRVFRKEAEEYSRGKN